MSFDERLRSVFADVFEMPPDAIDENLSIATSSEWDSMRSIVLATSLEAEFGIELTDDELLTLDSFKTYRMALLQKIGIETL